MTSADRLRGSTVPVYCCLNKIDLVASKARLLPAISAMGRAILRRDHPISAEQGTNCDRLLDLLREAMPERPAYFLPTLPTSGTFYVAEVIRG